MIYMTGTVAIICDIYLIYSSIKEENIPVAMFWVVMLLASILAIIS